MNLYLRLIIFLIRSVFRPKLDISGTSILRFHVLPNDLDLNMHMNNGRYLTIMDFGRMDLVLRGGMAKKVIEKKYIPVLGAAQIRFRIQLHPFQAYDLESRILSWDEKWFYMEQRFVIAKGKLKGAVAAIALVKGSFYDKVSKTTVRPVDTLALIGKDNLESPLPPEYLSNWITAETALRDVTAQ